MKHRLKKTSKKKKKSVDATEFFFFFTWGLLTWFLVTSVTVDSQSVNRGQWFPSTSQVTNCPRLPHTLLTSESTALEAGAGGHLMPVYTRDTAQ